MKQVMSMKNAFRNVIVTYFKKDKSFSIRKLTI